MPATRILSAIILTLMAFAAHAAEPAFRTKFNRKLIKGQQVLVCKRVKTPPKIDGEVDKDSVWRAVNRTQSAWTELGTKSVSGRQTVVYTCFDEKNLYFGFVCEEADLSRVSMDGNLKDADNVEVVLEIGGLMGDGDIYSFSANTRENRSQSWRSAGKFGPNRWMVEMAIPFSSLTKRRSRHRITDPQRGDVIGIKLARYGKTLKSGEARMISTANTHLPYRYLYLCGYNHLLYFEDSNVLQDGDFSASEDLSAWKIRGKTERVKHGIRLSKGTIFTQAVKLRKQSSYAVEIEQQGKGSMRVLADKQEVKLGKEKSGNFWNAGRDSAIITIEVLSDVTLRNIDLRHEPGIEPPGPWCLTSNYRKQERNIRGKLPDAPDGQYRYVKLDYMGRFAGDDNPGITTGRKWPYQAHLRVDDLGGRKGWIPFAKGSLTGRPEPIFWQTIIPKVVGWGRHVNTVLEVDLGQEYFVTGFDMHWPAPYIQNVEVWGKAESDEHWTLLHMADGEMVDPEKRIQYIRDKIGVGFTRTRGLNSVVRYLRWRGTGPNPYYPQLDGIQEFWVWGEPKGKREGLTAFKPWIAGEKTPPIKAETWTPNREHGQIVPKPRGMTLESGRFIVTPETRIVFQDEPIARKVARQIVKEIQERWCVELSAVREGEAGANESNFIYLGQPRLGKTARERAQGADLKLNPNPQGYGLRVLPNSAVILGCDGDGLYYGVQSMMMAMRWYQSADKSKCGPSVQCMKIIDWPGTMERSVHTSQKNLPGLLKAPVSEIWRIKRIFHLLSRFKYNVVYVPGEYTSDGGNWKGAAYGWPKGTLARLCREIQDEYHIEIRPDILSAEIEGGGWYRSLIGGSEAWDATAHDPDESARALGRSTNLCPLAPQTYELIFAKIDRILEQFAWPSQVMMYDQVYVAIGHGARWGVCRRCQRSGKTSAELYAYFLQRLSGHLKKRGARGLLRDKKLSYGSVGRSSDRLDVLQLSGNLRIDPSRFAPKSGNSAGVWEYLKRTVPPEFVVNGPKGWPCRERIVGGSSTIQGILHNFSGGCSYQSPWPNTKSTLTRGAQNVWYAPDSPPGERVDYANLAVWLNAWWYRRDYPAWRDGEEPKFHTIDLRRVVNHLSHPTGAEILEAGRVHEIDLRYLPTGKQTLSGVQFDIIDPSKNNGKAILMLGRPGKSLHPKVVSTISETAGPIPVGRKLASLAFLRTRWRGSLVGGGNNRWWAWLRPTCRVVYDDDSWLVADAFGYVTYAVWYETRDVGLCYRLGWLGNSPTSKIAALTVVEWVNPYPEKTIKYLDFFTPDMMERKGKRLNPQLEAIVAISGTDVVDQDIKFWDSQKHRPPRLPPRTPREEDIVELKRVSSRGKTELIGPQGKVGCAIKLMKDSLSYAYGPYPGVYCRKGFFPFGVTLAFAKPLILADVELSGPVHRKDANDGMIGACHQKHKVDVIVEYSEDGKSWKKGGELKGISSEAGFLPVRLPRIPVKALRMTGTGAPYHQYYLQNSKPGLLNANFKCPLFGWRLFAPAGAGKR